MADTEPVSIEAVVARRVKELRHARGLTQGQLAERVGAILGANWYATTVAKIEGAGTTRDGHSRQPRGVSMTELLALALALQVGPEALMLPRDPAVAVAVGKKTAPTFAFREWLAGRVGPALALTLQVPAPVFADTIDSTAKLLSGPFGKDPDQLRAALQAAYADYVGERGDEWGRAFRYRGAQYLEADVANLFLSLGLVPEGERRPEYNWKASVLEQLDKIEQDCATIRRDVEAKER